MSQNIPDIPTEDTSDNLEDEITTFWRIAVVTVVARFNIITLFTMMILMRHIVQKNMVTNITGGNYQQSTTSLPQLRENVLCCMVTSLPATQRRDGLVCMQYIQEEDPFKPPNDIGIIIKGVEVLNEWHMYAPFYLASSMF